VSNPASRHPDLEKLLNTSASNRGDNPEFGKVSSDRIDNGRLLPDEQMACALLLGTGDSLG
jgi:hypothetical protein